MVSQEEARTSGHAEIAPAHLALALRYDPESTAARALVGPGVAPEALAGAVAARLGPPSEAVPALIPYDLEAKKVLELTFREALRLGHDQVGTEHVLLALAEREAGDGPLAALGVSRDRAEAAIAEVR